MGALVTFPTEEVVLHTYSLPYGIFWRNLRTNSKYLIIEQQQCTPNMEHRAQNQLMASGGSSHMQTTLPL